MLSREGLIMLGGEDELSGKVGHDEWVVMAAHVRGLEHVRLVGM